MEMNFAGHSVDLSCPRVMGVLNVTPDSFSDGGRFHRLDSALVQAEKMVGEGAAFIDIGGESTRPGAAVVSAEEEMERVCPVVEAVAARFDVVVSVDTSTPQVITETARLGAGLVNDVRALTKEGAMEAAAAAGIPVCLMHMQGEPGTMQQAPHYDNVVAEVSRFLMDRVAAAREAGISSERILLDPGYGFGKTLEHNLVLLEALDQMHALGYPLLVGMSRKTMLGQITGRDVADRLPAGLAVATIAAMKGAAIIRVHDVRETVDAVKVVSALKEATA
ncbi:dihydropteroate synthase [Marinobacter halodurans]|uniref:Dihydropteroate synthase n=1 Tax=Marinobacter halodurans TaxID=2528979 RepID=A0ABY1ZIK8_9GAMM|nr:dihydropteroate synthase [Marinobacter halodurans]TBW48420.1 dihydropteroate synthase [Marinobacter halodurans]